MKPVFVRFGIALALLVVAPKARASDEKERAGALFQQAQQAFVQKNYAAAAAAFEGAAQLVPHPAAWLNAAEAWELDGDLPRAAQDCDRALAMPDANDTHRREATARLARMVPSVATLETVARAGSLGLSVTIDGGGEERVPTKDRLAPGRHVLVILDPSGTPARRLDIDLAAGETHTQDLTGLTSLSPTATGPRPADVAVLVSPAVASESSSFLPRRPPVASWIAFGTSAVAGVTAAIAGELTLSVRTDFTQAPTFDKRDEFYTMRTLTNVAWVTAGAAAIVGVLLWVVEPRERTPRGAGSWLPEGGRWLAQGARF